MQLNPLITSSQTGLPALREFLRELPPLLGQLDPFTRQINPILTGLGLYKQELNAFFANTVAATHAAEPNPNGKGLLHYLRTTNPLNPENLAVQRKRLATNRPNPYQFPGAFSSWRAACRCTRTASAAGPTTSSRWPPRRSTACIGGLTGGIITPALNQLDQPVRLRRRVDRLAGRRPAVQAPGRLPRPGPGPGRPARARRTTRTCGRRGRRRQKSLVAQSLSRQTAGPEPLSD